LALLAVLALLGRVRLYNKLREEITDAVRAEAEGLRADVGELKEEVRELSEKGGRYGDALEALAGIPRSGAPAGAAGNEEERLFRDIILEKIIHDYVREGLRCFDKKEYLKAHDLFSRALKLRRGDTTVQFYHIYSRYLGAVDSAFTARERETILAGLGELERKGYREEDLLVFSGEEMRQKVIERAYNIGEQVKRDGQGGR
jgi:hypothetical protein